LIKLVNLEYCEAFKLFTYPFFFDNFKIQIGFFKYEVFYDNEKEQKISLGHRLKNLYSIKSCTIHLAGISNSFFGYM